MKQDTYSNLYVGPIGMSGSELLQSSIKHTGPFALFSDCAADFVILKQAAAPECHVWRQKVTHCGQGSFEHFEQLRDRSSYRGKTQGEWAVAESDVDWSAYDIVICIDVAVSSATAMLHPKVLWCYYISEPCMPAYSSSRRAPVPGYQVFLNQRFDNKSVSTNGHEINFPFALQRFGCFDAALGKCAADLTREGCFIESHSNDDKTVSTLKSFGAVRGVSKSSLSIVEDLYKSKYFIRLGGRPMWGNAMIEAIASGCLVVGRPGEFRNRSLFTAATAVNDSAQLVARLKEFEANSDLYLREVFEQRRRLNYFCYYRPMRELLAKTGGAL